MIYLEIMGAIFSILGAIHLGYGTNKMIYRASYLFFVSNLSLLTFFIINGKIALIIQMTLFFITAIAGVLRLSRHYMRDLKIVFSVVVIYLSTMIMFFLFSNTLNKISFDIGYIDAIAALMAVYGSNIISKGDFKNKFVAYVLFILADLLFMYLGYINGFMFFMIQSAFFVFTSSFGLKNLIFLDKRALA